MGLENTVPPTVEALIMACLAKDPRQRPQSAAGIIQWIDALEGDAPGDAASTRVSARNKPVPELADAPPSRRWRLLAALALLALVVGLTVATTTRKRDEGAANASRTRKSTAASPTEASDGFKVLFNGRDLTGWEGDLSYWRVEDGAITAFAAEEGVKRRENTCLIWREPVSDFELRLSYRQKDVITAKPANSGIMYRARRVGDWQMRGYQMDLHGPVTGTLLLLQEDLKDPRVEAGRAAVLRTAGSQTAVEYLGATATARDRGNAFRRGDWNDVVIIAKGNRLVHKVNDVIMADVTDERPGDRAVSGLLALEMKRATVVQFRDIRLKKLD
jgi:hypothetical protein